MDNMDLKILDILSHDGRITHEKMGQQLGISRPAVHSRVRRLEEAGAILGYNAEIDWAKAGQGIRAFVFINVRTQNFDAIMDRIMAIDVIGARIEKCFRITGQWCLLLEVYASATSQITELHDELLKIKGMLETFTMLVLEEKRRSSS